MNMKLSVPEQAWTFWRRESSLPGTETHTVQSTAYSTTLSRVPRWGNWIVQWKKTLFCRGRGAIFSAIPGSTCYGLDGPRIEYRQGRDFPHLPDRPWGPPNLLYKGYPVSFQGLKRPVCGDDHSPPFSAEVEEKAELSICSSSGSTLPVLGAYLPYLLPHRGISVQLLGYVKTFKPHLRLHKASRRELYVYREVFTHFWTSFTLQPDLWWLTRKLAISQVSLRDDKTRAERNMDCLLDSGTGYNEILRRPVISM
jgi:hypothetical protein